MMPGFSIVPWKLIDKRFKIKKMQYNQYEVDHNQVKGQLRLLNVPTNILEVPKNLFPAEVANQEIPSFVIANPEFPSFVIATQVVLAFTSSLPRNETRVRTAGSPALNKREITDFIVDAPYEPWNEILLQGSPALLVRIRTILTKLEWIENKTDTMGGPALLVNHNVNHDVTIAPAGEAGLI
jgi:hypothetical protein